MIVTPKILARLVAIAILIVLLQLSFFSRVTFLETSPDILPAFVVVLGLLGGSMTGAVTGFSIGFLVDCLVAGTLGVTSLVLLGDRIRRRPLPRTLRDPQLAGAAAALHGA